MTNESGGAHWSPTPPPTRALTISVGKGKACGLCLRALRARNGLLYCQFDGAKYSIDGKHLGFSWNRKGVTQ